MIRRVALASVAAGLATIALTATVGGNGSSAPLPLPRTAAPARLPFSGGSTGTPTPSRTRIAGSATTTTVQAIQQQTFAIAPAPKLVGCTVSVSNPRPLQGHTAETATVSTTPGAHVRVEADYARSKSVHGGVAGGGGTLSVLLPVSHAPPGVAVPVSATTEWRGAQRTCDTSFTPAAVAG